MNTSKSGWRPIRDAASHVPEGTREGPPLIYHPHFAQDHPGLVTHYELEQPEANDERSGK